MGFSMHMGLDHVSNISARLRRINSRMDSLLNRLPLTDQRDLAELSWLAQSQLRLLRLEIDEKTVPVKERATLNRKEDFSSPLKESRARSLSTDTLGA